MKFNKILNIAIIVIISNISVNATSQQQIDKVEHISSTLQHTQNLNNTIQEFDEESLNSTNSYVSEFEKINSCNTIYKPYKLINISDEISGVLIIDKTIMNEMYPTFINKNCNGFFTTISDFNQKYFNKEQESDNTQIKNTQTKNKINHYINSDKRTTKYSEECDCIMCNKYTKKTIYNDQDIEKYNELVQTVNELACDFNELPLVQNNNKLKIKELFKSGLRNIKIKRNANNIVQKEICRLDAFIDKLQEKVEKVETMNNKLKRINNKHMLNKKRRRTYNKDQIINNNLEVLSSNCNISNNKNNISINNKNNVKNKNNNEDNLSISFSCLSASSLSLYDSSSSD